eukprot:5741000-Pyramimonas_sp.AAC.2
MHLVYDTCGCSTCRCPALLAEFEATNTRNLMIRSAFCFHPANFSSGVCACVTTSIPQGRPSTHIRSNMQPANERHLKSGSKTSPTIVNQPSVGSSSRHQTPVFPNIQPQAPDVFATATGPTGAGKSVLLAQLTHWARANGWLVFSLYSCAPKAWPNKAEVRAFTLNPNGQPAGPRGKRGYILTTDQSDAESAGIFSRWTNQTQDARVCSHDGPIRRRTRGYILTTDQSDAGSA